jgi:hypothetical protein
MLVLRHGGYVRVDGGKQHRLGTCLGNGSLGGMAGHILFRCENRRLADRFCLIFLRHPDALQSALTAMSSCSPGMEAASCSSEWHWLRSTPISTMFNQLACLGT